MKSLITLLVLGLSINSFGYEGTEITAPTKGVRCVFYSSSLLQHVDLDTSIRGSSVQDIQITNHSGQENLRIAVIESSFTGTVSIRASTSTMSISVEDVNVERSKGSIFNPEDNTKTMAKMILEINKLGKLYCASAKTN